MNTELLSENAAFKIIKILGILQLAIGLFSLVLAPLEIYSFYLFTKGGRFYYEDFGIGSFLLLGFVGLVASIPFVSVIPVIIGFSVASLVIGQIWDVNASG